MYCWLLAHPTCASGLETSDHIPPGRGMAAPSSLYSSAAMNSQTGCRGLGLRPLAFHQTTPTLQAQVSGGGSCVRRRWFCRRGHARRQRGGRLCAGLCRQRKGEGGDARVLLD